MKKILFGIILMWSCMAFAADKVVSFSFYGKDVQVRFDTSRRVKVKSGTNGELVKCLEWLNDATFETSEDCMRIKKEMNLSDWAYVQFLGKFAEASLGKTNEAVLLMAWMMDVSEYNVGICKGRGGKVQMMFLTDAELTNYHPMESFGKIFYAYEDSTLTTFKNYQRLSTVGNPVSFRKFGDQKFGVEPMDPITVTSKKNANFSFTFRFNKYMVDFFRNVPTYLYNNDPLQRWVIMAQTPLEQYMQNTLIRDMKQKVAGMCQQEAIQQIMWWVQSFDHVNDGEKNVMLSRLVRDVLGLKVAFICYPANTAIAVSITDADVRGAYVVNKGRHYVLCDASYAGGLVGQENPATTGQKKILTLLDQ